MVKNSSIADLPSIDEYIVQPENLPSVEQFIEKEEIV